MREDVELNSVLRPLESALDSFVLRFDVDVDACYISKIHMLVYYIRCLFI